MAIKEVPHWEVCGYNKPMQCKNKVEYKEAYYQIYLCKQHRDEWADIHFEKVGK